MNRIAFIIPYFGKFNNYFQLFLNSCKFNDDLCDWFIFTDDKGNYQYPLNVKVQYCNFKDLQDRIKAKFDFDLEISRPYKLCDYKPAYGYIFEEYIKEYSHWGHCDVDLIFGKLSHFLKNQILESYDKIFNLGHCTIYRNSLKNNRQFMGKLNGKERYKEVYRSYKNCSFDEEYNESINNIFEQACKRVFSESFAANIYTKSSDFRLCVMDLEDKKYYIEKRKEAFFIWNRGLLIRKQIQNFSMKEKEFMYIHLQSRPMKVHVADNALCYKIIPNAFEYLEIPRDEITKNNFKNIKMKHINFHYFRLRSKNLLIKCRRIKH